MLGKLIKHEIKATGRILFPLYLILLLLSVVNRVLTSIEVFSGPLNTIIVFMLSVYGLSVFASFVVTFIVMILRFYKNLMSDEGYLMFTIPVKPNQLINSKIIVSFMLNILSIIVVAASLFILLGTSKNIEMIKQIWDYIYINLKLSFEDKYAVLLAELIFMIILSLIQQILLIYVSIAVGHLFTGHKVLGSFAAYIAINTVGQILVTIIISILAVINGTSFEALDSIPQLLFPFSIVVSIIFCILFYLGTNYIFNRKLNLE